MTTATLILTLSLSIANSFGGTDTHTATHTMTGWATVEVCEESKADLLARGPQAFMDYLSPEFIYEGNKDLVVINIDCITQ